MQSIGQPINKDSPLEASPALDLRTLDELLRLAEIRLLELEKRVSYLEGQGHDVGYDVMADSPKSKIQFLEVVRLP